MEDGSFLDSPLLDVASVAAPFLFPGVGAALPIALTGSRMLSGGGGGGLLGGLFGGGGSSGGGAGSFSTRGIEKQMKKQRKLQKRMYADYQKQLKKANRANERRFTEAMGLQRDFGSTGQQMLRDAGTADIRDANEGFRQVGAQAQQGLVSRGLAGTTVGNTLKQGNERERLAAVNRIKDRVNLQRLGLKGDVTNSLAGILERRDDVAPNPGLLAQLSSQSGQSFGSLQGGGGSNPYMMALMSSLPQLIGLFGGGGALSGIFGGRGRAA